MKGRSVIANELRQVIADLEYHVDSTARLLITITLNSLEEATPKDTTHAASNWLGGVEPPVSPAGARQDPDAHLGEAQDGRLVGHPQVAGQSQLEPAAEDGAVHRRRDGSRRRIDAGD